MNIFLIGMPLVGKSLIGKLLATRLGYNFIDTDEVLISRDVSLQFSKKHEKQFRHHEKLVYQLDFGSNTVVATGGGVVYDEENFTFLRGLTIYLKTSISELSYRQIKYNHPVYKIYKLNKLYNKRSPIYEKYAQLVIDTTGLDANEVVENIYEKIKENLNH